MGSSRPWQKVRSKFCFCLKETRFIETATVFISDCMSFLKNHRNIVAVTGAGGDDVANTQHHFIQLEHILKCLKILHECLEEGQPNGHAGGNGGQRPLVPMPPTRLKRLREDSGGEQRGLVATGVNGSIDDDGNLVGVFG